MKKKYKKPTVSCELFRMSQSIAACFFQLNQADVKNCETIANTGDFAWGVQGTFIQDNGECTNIEETYCYTTGAGTYSTYMS